MFKFNVLNIFLLGHNLYIMLERNGIAMISIEDKEKIGGVKT